MLHERQDRRTSRNCKNGYIIHYVAGSFSLCYVFSGCSVCFLLVSAFHGKITGKLENSLDYSKIMHGVLKPFWNLVVQNEEYTLVV